jgi:hypothetical protein
MANFILDEVAIVILRVALLSVHPEIIKMQNTTRKKNGLKYFIVLNVD